MSALLAGAAFALTSPSAAAQQPPRTNSGVRALAGDSLAGIPALAPLMARPVSELASVVQRYSDDRAALFRKYDASGSPDQRTRARAFYSGWRARLRELDHNRLSAEGKVDWVLLDNRLRHELDLLDRAAEEAQKQATLIPFADALLGLQDARRRLSTLDAPAAARTLVRAHTQADSLRKLFEAPAARAASNGGAGSAAPTAPPATPLLAFHAAARLDELRNTLGSWQRFYEGYDPAYNWWVRDPFKKLDESLKAYAKTLRERVVGWRTGEEEPIVGQPIGAAGLEEDLRYEMIPYTPEELIAIAEREYAWSLNEMKRASREMGFGDDWHKAVEKVKGTFVEPGKQPDLIRDLAWQAEEFFRVNDFVTIPELAHEDWRMEMMTPERQRVAPFFLGGELILVAYPTDGMTAEEKLMSLRGNNPHFSHAVVFHELNPGHHLQGFMSQRYNPHRRAFSTPFWNEGGALYWEMFLWDHGFHKSPEDRVGALVWRMHRSARIIFSLSYHLGRMTPPQAVDFLVEKVGFERANSEAEVRRSFNGSYPPLYQMAYMIGGLQLRALHKEIVGSGKMTDKQFHDAILAGGPMPIEMLRARLLNTPPGRDFRTQWKFGGLLGSVQ